MRKRYIICSLLILFGISYLLVFRILGQLGIYNNMSDTGAELFFTFVFHFLGLAIIPIVVIAVSEKIPPKNLPREFGMRRFHWAYIPISILLGFFCLGTSTLIGFFQTLIMTSAGWMPSRSLPETYTLAGFFLAVFCTCITPSITEEISDRVVMDRMLSSSPKMSDAKKILLIALMFSLTHANILQTFTTFMGGVVMAMLFVRTKSLIPSMIVHFVNNFTITYLDFADAFGWPGGDYYASLRNVQPAYLLLYFFAMLVSVAGVTVMLILIWKKTKPAALRSKMKEKPVFFNEISRTAYFGAPAAVSDMVRPRDRIFFICALLLGAGATVASLIAGML